MTTDNPYRALPSVDRLLAHDRVRAITDDSHDVAAELARQALAAARHSISRGANAPSDDQLAESGR